MKHREVKQLQQELNLLLNECVTKKIAIFHLNYGLDKNAVKLEKAVQEINKGISKELIELDQKALAMGKKENSLLEVEKQTTDENSLFNSGLLLLSDEEKEKRNELSNEYIKAMEEENDLQLFVLDPTKLENLPIEYPYYLILKKFFPVEVE
jgi:hypothetical protein